MQNQGFSQIEPRTEKFYPAYFAHFCIKNYLLPVCPIRLYDRNLYTSVYSFFSYLKNFVNFIWLHESRQWEIPRSRHVVSVYKSGEKARDAVRLEIITGGFSHSALFVYAW